MIWADLADVCMLKLAWNMLVLDIDIGLSQGSAGRNLQAAVLNLHPSLPPRSPRGGERSDFYQQQCSFQKEQAKAIL